MNETVANEVTEQIKQIASRTSTEEQLQTAVISLIQSVFPKVRPVPQSRGPGLWLFNLLIDFTRPNLLDGSGALERQRRMSAYLKTNQRLVSRIVYGVLLDGFHFIFGQKDGDSIAFEPPVPVNPTTTNRFLDLIRNSPPEDKLFWQYTHMLGIRRIGNTVNSYGSDIRIFLLYCLDRKLDFLTLTPSDIEEFLFSRRKRKGAEFVPLSRPTLNHYRSSLTSFYNYSRREKLLQANPAKEVETFSTHRLVVNFLDVNDVRELRNSCNPKMLPLIEFILSTGVRISEALALTWNNVSLGYREAKVMGKGGRERRVRFSDRVREILLQRDRFSLSSRIFSELQYSQVYCELRRIGKLLGKKITPHTLRHTCASLLVEGGMSLTRVRDQLGHTNISTTSLYLHSSSAQESEYDAAVERFSPSQGVAPEDNL